MPVLLLKGNSLVKGKSFQSWRRIGPVVQAMQIYEKRGVDEIVLLDISATAENRPIDIQTIKHASSNCFTPLTVGGGIRSIEDIRAILSQTSADKVSINTTAVINPSLIRTAAEKFGRQCVVVSIDTRRSEKTVSGYEVFIDCGNTSTKLDVAVWARQAAILGAGEILLTSIENDGTMEGYDLNLIRLVSSAVNIPIIAAGGAKDYRDMEAAFEAGADAAASTALFQFTESTPLLAKEYLNGVGYPMRMT